MFPCSTCSIFSRSFILKSHMCISFSVGFWCIKGASAPTYSADHKQITTSLLFLNCVLAYRASWSMGILVQVRNPYLLLIQNSLKKSFAVSSVWFIWRSQHQRNYQNHRILLIHWTLQDCSRTLLLYPSTTTSFKNWDLPLILPHNIPWHTALLVFGVTRVTQTCFIRLFFPALWIRVVLE